MWQICDIIETFDPEAGVQCFKSTVIKRHPEHQLLDYLRILRCLPLMWEDSITQMNHIHPELLLCLAQGVKKVNKPVALCDTPIDSQCHLNALNLVNQYPLWELYSGFAKIEEECVAGDDWHLHSFCITTERLIEPTPKVRSMYYGRAVPRGILTTMVSQ